MNELQIINIDGVECYEKDGTAYLKLETVARGLGFTDNSKGVEYVRWNTVRQYLKDIGFSQEVAKDDFIPENVFYRLAMKAKNEVAEKFQAKVADEIIPSIRRTGGYVLQGLSKEMQAILMIDQKQVKMEERLDHLEYDIPLYGSEADELSNHVKRKGVAILGGKRSEAYNDSKIRDKVYRDIYGCIKREFGIYDDEGRPISYKALKRKYLADAHDLIDCYEAPTYLSELIDNANAQQRMDGGEHERD